MKKVIAIAIMLFAGAQLGAYGSSLIKPKTTPRKPSGAVQAPRKGYPQQKSAISQGSSHMLTGYEEPGAFNPEPSVHQLDVGY